MASGSIIHATHVTHATHTYTGDVNTLDEHGRRIYELLQEPIARIVADIFLNSTLCVRGSIGGF